MSMFPLQNTNLYAQVKKIDPSWKSNGTVTRVYAPIDVLGFYSVRLCPNRILFMEHFCVHSSFRREGIGGILHRDLLKTAELGRIRILVTVVYEKNPHLDWLKRLGWKAVSVKRNYFENGDGYVFQRRINQ